MSCRVLPDAIDMLHAAQRLRQCGTIPRGTVLWAAGNPVTEADAGRLAAKAEAGATGFLTQPPLAWREFELWMADARRRRVTDECDVFVGIPMLTSPAVLRFWISLCGASVTGAAPT